MSRPDVVRGVLTLLEGMADNYRDKLKAALNVEDSGELAIEGWGDDLAEHMNEATIASADLLDYQIHRSKSDKVDFEKSRTGNDIRLDAQTPGLKWEDVGTVRPHTGIEMQNEALAAALQYRTEFCEDELSAFNVSIPSCDCYIKVLDRYYKPRPSEKERARKDAGSNSAENDYTDEDEDEDEDEGVGQIDVTQRDLRARKRCRFVPINV
jgi:hypothetical protein